MLPQKTIFVDLGNSSVKFMFDDGQTNRMGYSQFSFRFFLERFSNFKVILVYASVNYKQLKKLIKPKKTITAISAFKLLEDMNIVDLEDVSGMGEDRIFGLIGALEQKKPPIITIDCGSAFTINVIDRNYKVLGGAIMPGPELQRWALRARTENLKNIEVSLPDDLIGRDTETAVGAGIYYGLSGAIISIVSNIIEDKFQNENVNIFLTGGSAAGISHIIGDALDTINDEKLVLNGIKYTYEKWLTVKK